MTFRLTAVFKKGFSSFSPLRNGFILFYLILPSFFSYSQAEEVSSKKLNSFRFRMQGDPETLDWNRAHTLVEAYILMNIMEGLVTYNSVLKPVPALAESWTLSADKKTYTFHLRAGVRWSDGVPLKAKDFVYSWKRLLSPVTAAPYAYFLYDIEGAQEYGSGKIKDFEKVGVKAFDDSTLVVKLANPVANWISMLGFWVTFPVRQDIIEKYGDGWDSPGRMVNLGPFSLESIDHASKVVLKANSNYYGSRGNIEQIIAQILSDDQTALNLYQKGELDFLAGIASGDLKKFKKRSDLKSFAHLKTNFLGFVTTKYPSSSLKLRRAIAMAIDKTKFLELLSGNQKPAQSFVPPGLMGYSKSMGLPFFPAKARMELSGSGIDTSVPLKLEYLLPDWDKAQTVAKFIQQELKKNLGIDVILKAYENKTFRTLLDLYSFPVFDYSWTADYPDPYNFLSVFLGNSGNSQTGWKNGEYDKLIQTARITASPSLREQLYLKAQKILLEDEVVIIPLYYEPNLVLVQSRVKGFELNPLDYFYLRNVNVVP